MAAVHGVRALLRLHQSVMLRHSFGFIPLLPTSTCLPRMLCSSDTKSNELKPPMNPENESLLENLIHMGVDVEMARQRQPGVLRKTSSNEQGLAQFLQDKGVSPKAIASIISRYPRAITRSIDHLSSRWELWKNILKTDEEIVSVLDRSPEPFFRSSDNEKLEKNITFLISLGLRTKDLCRLLTTAPRTFSNSVELNMQMVACLVDICVKLGGKNPKQFPKAVISRNPYIFIRSTKRVKANIETLRSSLELSDSDLLDLLQGPGAEILNPSSEFLQKNCNTLQQRMVSLGCPEVDIKKLVFSYPVILYMREDTLNSKLDCLLKAGITMKQIVEKPRVLDYSTQNITWRLEELQRVGYDFQKNGIAVLDSSRKRFTAKVEKLEKNEKAAAPHD